LRAFYAAKLIKTDLKNDEMPESLAFRTVNNSDSLAAQRLREGFKSFFGSRAINIKPAKTAKKCLIETP
jgi:hypothetical protein